MWFFDGPGSYDLIFLDNFQIHVVVLGTVDDGPCREDILAKKPDECRNKQCIC